MRNMISLSQLTKELIFERERKHSSLAQLNKWTRKETQRIYRESDLLLRILLRICQGY